MFPKRGEIYLVALDPVQGSEEGKTRPAVIIQNDLGNQFSQTTVVVPVTSRLPERRYPHEIFINGAECGLNKDGTILLAQIRCLDKSRILRKIGTIPLSKMKEVDQGLKKNLALEQS